jgi:UDP-N-acetylglucosamine--N-acetylmuramyl-(pentapeptide) pyrophosphoryl-undecaprenol N-acetylglucosamine transferase
VICRAGALTIAELSAAGVASILVPFPYAVDDHQTANARYLSDQGAAILIPEHELTPEGLGRLLIDFYNARQGLLNMAQQARRLAKPQATRDVAEICLKAAYAG